MVESLVGTQHAGGGGGESGPSDREAEIRRRRRDGDEAALVRLRRSLTPQRPLGWQVGHQYVERAWAPWRRRRMVVPQRRQAAPARP